MQSGNASEPAGMFQQLSSGSSGGGGGGGSGRSYARFNQIQAVARHYVKQDNIDKIKPKTQIPN